MGTGTEDGSESGKARDAFVAAMKKRVEEGQALGQSPEEIAAGAREFAREAARRRAPEVAAAARSWWVGFRRFLVIGTLAIALSAGLALYVEHRHAAPLCERYAAGHGLRYAGLGYPILGRSSSTSSSSGRCILVDTAGRSTTVSLSKLEPDAAVGLAASFALQLEFTIPALFVLIALAAAPFLRRR